MTSAVGDGKAEPAAYSSTYLWYVILLLTMVNVVNYMDRMVLSVLLPLIKQDLQLSDTQLGLITGIAFAVFYACFGLPIARLADSWVRRNIIVMAMCFWSLMTALSGAAQNFLHLMAARIGIGAGEAGCIPPSHSLIGDYFPAEKRAGALGLHTTGTAIGTIFGIALGGVLSAHIGWRWTFVIMGVPGILLALLVWFTLKEPPRGYADKTASDDGVPPLREVVSYLAKRRSYLHVVGYFAFGTLGLFGFNQWLPSFYSRSYGMSQEEIGLFFGISHGLGTAIGTVAGGYYADRLMRIDVRKGATMGIILTLAAFPFWLGISAAQVAWLSITCNFIAGALASAPNGAALAMLQNVVSSRMRAVASAFLMFSAAIVGIGGGPFVTGLLSDFFSATRGEESLRYSLFIMSFFTLWPAVHLYFTRKSVREDMAQLIALGE